MDTSHKHRSKEQVCGLKATVACLKIHAAQSAYSRSNYCQILHVCVRDEWILHTWLNVNQPRVARSISNGYNFIVMANPSIFYCF